MELSKVTNIQFDGIDHRDYPDFCDAYICYAEYDGEPMTDEQLEELHENIDFVYNELMNHIF
jgi:hypothetical protein